MEFLAITAKNRLAIVLVKKVLGNALHVVSLGTSETVSNGLVIHGVIGGISTFLAVMQSATKSAFIWVYESDVFQFLNAFYVIVLAAIGRRTLLKFILNKLALQSFAFFVLVVDFHIVRFAFFLLGLLSVLALDGFKIGGIVHSLLFARIADDLVALAVFANILDVELVLQLVVVHGDFGETVVFDEIGLWPVMVDPLEVVFQFFLASLVECSSAESHAKVGAFGPFANIAKFFNELIFRFCEKASCIFACLPIEAFFFFILLLIQTLLVPVVHVTRENACLNF